MFTVILAQPVPLGRVSVSSTERQWLLSKLSAADVECVKAPGAGYKCLLVVTRQVQAYVCTKVS